MLGLTFHFFGYDAYFYWAASYAAMHKLNVYDPEQFREILTLVGYPTGMGDVFSLPPWSLWLFAPLALLPFEVSRVLWLLLLFYMLVAALRIVMRISGQCGGGAAACSLRFCRFVFFAFPPTVAALVWGNHIIVIFFGICAAWQYLQLAQGFRAGIFLSLVLLKPHLFLPLLSAALVAGCLGRESRMLLGLTLGFAAQAVLSFIIDPMSFTFYLDFLQSGGYEGHLQYPGISVAQVVLLLSGWDGGRYVFPVVGILSGAVVGALSRGLFRRSNHTFVLLAVGLLLAPYCWGHSMIVLAPVYMSLMLSARARYSETAVLRAASVLLLVTIPVIILPKLDYLFLVLLVVLAWSNARQVCEAELISDS